VANPWGIAETRLTPREILRRAAEAFNGPGGSKLLLQAFDNVERFCYLPGVSKALTPGR
jgi:hypothetical protein